MAVNLLRIIPTVLEAFRLPWDSDHGVAHWARVLENGLRLAGETGADIEVVQLFAVFHDSCRVNEFTGSRPRPGGALFVRELRGRLFELPDVEFERLYRACAGHTHERTHPDITIQTCWDADRLDLGRVGITPHPRHLGTDAARKREMIRWADGRASLGFIPEFVEQEWGIDLALDR